MERTNEIQTEIEAGTTRLDAVVDRLTEQLLAKSREALRSGGNDARRQIVRTTIQLERLLREEVR